MNAARILVACIFVGLTSIVLTGCQPTEEEKAAQPATVIEAAKPAVAPAAKAEKPASTKPKDHPAH